MKKRTKTSDRALHKPPIMLHARRPACRLPRQRKQLRSNHLWYESIDLFGQAPPSHGHGLDNRRDVGAVLQKSFTFFYRTASPGSTLARDRTS